MLDRQTALAALDSRRNYIVLRVLLAVVVVGWHIAANAAAAPAARQIARQPVVNINTATVAQLQLLPWVGKVLAQRIDDYRALHGPFMLASDIMQVRGVGEKRFAAIAPYVVTSGLTTATGKIHTAQRVGKDGGK